MAICPNEGPFDFTKEDFPHPLFGIPVGFILGGIIWLIVGVTPPLWIVPICGFIMFWILRIGE